MYPVCASATTNPGTTVSSYGNISSGGCTFPGTTNKKTFSDQTIPSAKSSNGALSGIALTNITENTTTKVVTFSFTKSTTDAEITTASSINCYPSPFSDNLNISSQGPLKSITIYDLTGKIIVYQTATGENIQTVNTSALSNGYYLVKVVDANGIATTIKTVKQ